MNGYMYILECADGSYYTGSTNNMELRLQQHQNGEGANHTKKRLPVKLVYFEVFDRIDTAFYREKQVQGWSRKKKEALINQQYEKLPELSKNYAQFPPLTVPSTGSGTEIPLESENNPVVEHQNNPVIEHENNPVVEHENNPVVEPENNPVVEPVETTVIRAK